MAGIPEGQRRVNFNASEELYKDLCTAQTLLGRTAASVLRQALVEFLARALPDGSLGSEQLPDAIRMHRPAGLGKPRNELRIATPPISVFARKIAIDCDGEPEGVKQIHVPDLDSEMLSEHLM